MTPSAVPCKVRRRSGLVKPNLSGKGIGGGHDVAADEGPETHERSPRTREALVSPCRDYEHLPVVKSEEVARVRLYLPCVRKHRIDVTARVVVGEQSRPGTRRRSRCMEVVRGPHDGISRIADVTSHSELPPRRREELHRPPSTCRAGRPDSIELRLDEVDGGKQRPTDAKSPVRSLVVLEQVTRRSGAPGPDPDRRHEGRHKRPKLPSGLNVRSSHPAPPPTESPNHSVAQLVPARQQAVDPLLIERLENHGAGRLSPPARMPSSPPVVDGFPQCPRGLAKLTGQPARAVRQTLVGWGKKRGVSTRRRKGLQRNHRSRSLASGRCLRRGKGKRSENERPGNHESHDGRRSFHWGTLQADGAESSATASATCEPGPPGA
jgi:hypothetical protein